MGLQDRLLEMQSEKELVCHETHANLNLLKLAYYEVSILLLLHICIFTLRY